jgi:hypothetical protein
MTTVTTTGNAIGGSERRTLIRHFFEMVVAMLVGMAALGVVVRVICAGLGYSGVFVDHVGLRAPLMAMNMTIGMAAWMRHRGHGWAPIGEMSAAMFAPLPALIGRWAQSVKATCASIDTVRSGRACGAVVGFGAGTDRGAAG